MSAKPLEAPFEAKRIEKTASGEWLWCVSDANGMFVVRRASEQNAKLFAAAPDLLEALQLLTGPICSEEEDAEIHANAAAAIAKAGADAIQPKKLPRFENVACSQCGGTFGPGEHGFSHCENHQGKARTA